MGASGHDLSVSYSIDGRDSPELVVDIYRSADGESLDELLATQRIDAPRNLARIMHKRGNSWTSEGI